MLLADFRRGLGCLVCCRGECVPRPPRFPALRLLGLVQSIVLLAALYTNAPLHMPKKGACGALGNGASCRAVAGARVSQLHTAQT